MANALANETSPYLRQHAANPVAWLPWGEQAFAAARERDQPLLVSIGYSSCHWCHVMERESFEDPATAELMNDSFVCVKVDREERPDVDALYMEAVQGMTGRGGWPLNVFLTPTLEPFYGGTYFPPEQRHGMPSWRQVLIAIAETWDANREQIRAGGVRLREQLAASSRLRPSDEPVTAAELEQAVTGLRASYDSRDGGFGQGGPRFPQASVLEFLLLMDGSATAGDGREMALHVLRAMARGGIYDQLAGGFSRYSVDASWTVPHFEKMLYDNALLARAYLHGFEASGDERLREVVVQTLDWALREMRGPEGGFYSALDADSEGVEGRFYVWTEGQLNELLGDDAAAAIAWLGVSAQGNFDEGGLNVLTDRGPRPPREQRERIRERLLAARAQRVRPGLDDKRITSWNALMVAALADAGAALGGADGERYLQAATDAADFLLTTMRDADGRLLRSYNDGRAKIPGFLEDHAFLLEALIVLFEASCDARWYEPALALADTMIERFADRENGGFFVSPDDGEQLIARRKDLEDSPIPSGSSSAAAGLLRLAELSGEQRYEGHGASVLALAHEIAARHPTAFGHLLQAMYWRLAPARPIACEVPATGSPGSGRAPTASPARGSRPIPGA
jgi:uncharacterized protein